jgi:hypothetical protein
MKMTWSSSSCKHGQSCLCDLNVKLLQPFFENFSVDIPRTVGFLVRDNKQMVFVAAASICAQFQMSDYRIRHVDYDLRRVMMVMTLDMREASNQFKIPPYFDYPIVPKSLPLPPPEPLIMTAYREYDFWYLREKFEGVTREMLVAQVWHDIPYSSFKGVTLGKVVSLQIAALRMASAFNIAFGSNGEVPFTFRSMDNLYSDKMALSMAKFDCPTANLNANCKKIAHLIPLAVMRMNSYMGVTKYYGKVQFDPGKIFMGTPTSSSSGARAGGRRQVGTTDNGIQYVQSVTGKKLEQRAYAYKNYMRMVEEAKTQIPHDNDHAWVISPKSEIFNVAGKTLAEARKAMEKLRHYNISFYTLYLAEYHVLHHRQLLERGRMIKIGMPWWRGGALSFYNSINGSDPDMRYSDGDVRNFDMSVKRHFMEMYVASAGVYIRDDQNKQTYVNLQRYVLRRLTRRPTHMYGNTWRMIFGGMPSGAYSTSHGDSWILGLMFWFFFEFTRVQYPSWRQKLDVYYAMGQIIFVDYGDDHVIGAHKAVYHLINEKKFAEFLFKYLDMFIKDIKMDAPALSVANEFGGVSSAGVVFLKRYLIAKPRHFTEEKIASVVPYRPTWNYYYKIPFGSDGPRTIMDCVLSTIGNAYDTMGTNLHAYTFLKFINTFLMSQPAMHKISIREMYLEHVKRTERTDVTRMMRKSSISMDELCRGFPSLSELELRHVYDADYQDFTPDILRPYS